MRKGLVIIYRNMPLQRDICIRESEKWGGGGEREREGVCLIQFTEVDV